MYLLPRLRFIWCPSSRLVDLLFRERFGAGYRVVTVSRRTYSNYQGSDDYQASIANYCESLYFYNTGWLPLSLPSHRRPDPGTCIIVLMYVALLGVLGLWCFSLRSSNWKRTYRSLTVYRIQSSLLPHHEHTRHHSHQGRIIVCCQL